MHLPTCGLLCFALFAGAVPGQQTWRVAAAGGAPFTDIGAAVAAASDGDVIVVEPGNYLPFVVHGKALTIVGQELGGNGILVGQASFGAPGASPVVTIENLAPNQHVQLSGMQLSNFGVPVADLLVRDCSGPVWLESLWCDSYGAIALRIERSSDVVLRECFLQTDSTPAAPSGSPVPGPGALFVDSVVVAHDSQFYGSHGVTAFPGLPVGNGPADGGSGIELVDARLDLQGGVARGANGLSFLNGGCLLGSSGGDGIVLRTAGGAPPVVRMRDVTVMAGVAGFASCGPVPSNGVVTRVLAGQQFALPGAARLLQGNNVFIAPGTAQFDVRGAAGDVAFVFAALPAPTVPVLGIAVHVTSPLLPLGTVAIGSGGQAPFLLALPALPPGLSTFLAAMQAAVFDSSGGLFATGPLTLVVR